MPGWTPWDGGTGLLSPALTLDLSWGAGCEPRHLLQHRGRARDDAPGLGIGVSGSQNAPGADNGGDEGVSRFSP